MVVFFFFSDEQVAIVLTKKITEAFEAFASDVLKDMQANPKLASLPVQVCDFLALNFVVLLSVLQLIVFPLTVFLSVFTSSHPSCASDL